MDGIEPEGALGRLLRIMATLRSPSGCPWDARQTPESLQPFLLEETYETLEALDSGDPRIICEELGDLLLQIVFLARIFEERGAFGMGEVAQGIAEKLERRHPHVFGDAPTSDLAVLDAQWERIKQEEKAGPVARRSPFADIPQQLPALARAAKVAEKAARLGEETKPEPPQLESRMEALRLALRKEDLPAVKTSMGHLLYDLAGFARTLDLDAEQILRTTVDKVIAQVESRVDDRAEEEKGSPGLDES